MFYSFFFFFVPVITFVYYVDKQTKKHKNITLNTIFGINLTNYSEGTYYIKMIDKYATYHLIFEGYLYEKDYVKCPSDTLSVDRKNILLLHNDCSLDTNIDFLDHYWMMVPQVRNAERNMEVILTTLGIKCNKIKIVDFPHISTHNPKLLSIDYLYKM